ncbi:MAG: hypothetical protein P1V36_12690 [Planctomycetota bacterium]|nr:hypothetical protein [Planctomycetota bacterium]
MIATSARIFVALLSLSLLTTFSVAPAQAGEDDFEFGQALAALGTKTGDKAYFTYARRVYDKVIADENRSDEMKDLCRYGLALMGRDEALGASGNPTKKYDDVLALFKTAVETMEAFVKKNPDHARADEARLKVGETRLAFVTWGRSLLESPEKREERGATASQVQRDAEAMVRGAIGYFNKLRTGHDDQDATQLSQIAQYYWVICQYYLALVYETGTDESKSALDKAALALDDFITLNDGQLLAIYAQDFMGLTAWEQARAATNDDDKSQFYRQAVEWFGTCIDTPVEDLDSQRIVANGYYHLGQVCNEAGRVGSTNFHRIGVARLKDMLAQHNTIWRQDNGIRALLELARLELARDRQNEAVEVARQAGEYAKTLGKGWLERQANRILEEIIAGRGSSAGGSNADPSVLMRVADSIYSQQKWTEAIAAYQGVIGGVKPTPENAQEYLIRSWRRISTAYGQLGDQVAAAIALEPIHAIWMDGLVDKTTGGKNNPNLIELGNVRLRAQKMWKDLHSLTGSATFNRRHGAIRDSFPRDYPNHPSKDAGLWNGAMEKFRQANEQKRAKNNRWRTSMNEADTLFKKVASDMNSQKQDSAWTYLIYTQYLRESWDGVLKAVANAYKFWDSAAAKTQEEKFETVAKRRKPERGKAAYWKTEALYRKASAEKDPARATAMWDEVLADLKSWHTDYSNLRGGANKRFYAGTLGHIVFAHIGKGDIPNADKVFRRLLSEDPEYIRLPKVTFALARHFNDQAKVIDSARKQARIELNGTEEQEGVRSKLRTVERREQQVLEFRVDQEGALSKVKELVAVYEKKKADEEDTEITETQYTDAQARIPVLEKKISELTEQGNKLTAEREKLQTRAAELMVIVKEKAQELYEPLTRAAGYFWEWDNALKLAKLKRDPNNVAIFADLYFKAGLLRPEVQTNWDRSRSLYEDLYEFEDSPEQKKHEALGRLGSIYSSLAGAAEEGSDARAALVAKALDRLQGSLSLLAANNDMVVAHLEGKSIVLPYLYEDVNKTFYFPLPRAKTVDEFKAIVAKMGKAGGPPLPAQATEVDRKRYMNAVKSFQNKVLSLKPFEIERTVKGFAGAGFDMRFYRRLARSGKDFRLALARMYMESGAPENMTKAVNLASSLLSGSYGADENGEMWWAAQVVRLGALVRGAEIEAKKAGSGGKLSPTAVDWTERASMMLRGMVTTNPDLGDDVRPATRDEMKALHARIRTLRGKAGLKAMNLLIVKPAAVPNENK